MMFFSSEAQWKFWVRSVKQAQTTEFPFYPSRGQTRPISHFTVFDFIMLSYSGKWVARLIAFCTPFWSCHRSLASLTTLVKLESTLSPQPLENPSPHISVNSEETHSWVHRAIRVRPSVGGSAMGKCLVAEKTCTKLNSPLGWVGVTRPALPACSFIIPGLITDWTGCLVCLMLAQLLHGRNGLVSLCYNTLYYHLHFIYLAQISRQATCPPTPPKDTCNSALLNLWHLLGNYSK